MDFSPCPFYGINYFLFGLTCFYYYLYSVGTAALHAYLVVVYHTSVVRGLSLLFLLWALRCALSDSLLTSNSSFPPLCSCQLGPPHTSQENPTPSASLPHPFFFSLHTQMRRLKHTQHHWDQRQRSKQRAEESRESAYVSVHKDQ